MNRKFKNPIIVALDNVELDARKIVALIRQLSGKVWGFKITDLHDRSLFSSNQGSAIESNIMVDVKICDIPTVAANRARVLAEQGASIITVHASGGHRMLEACINAIRDYDCWIAPVCVLTSMEEDEVMHVFTGNFDKTFSRLARYVFDTYEDMDLDERPLVIPPNKLYLIPTQKSSIAICPGIRPTTYTIKDDQRNINTPSNAMREGADLLVIGRPIMESPDPVAAVESIMKEVNAAIPFERRE